MRKIISKTVIGCLLIIIFLFSAYQFYYQLSLSSLVPLDIKYLFSFKPPGPNKETPFDQEAPKASFVQPGEIKCDRSYATFDICKINGLTVLDPTTSTFYLTDPPSPSPSPYIVEKVRPYPRKGEIFTMKRIKELTLTSIPKSPPCKAQHNAPAMVFSAGGYTGNFFHEFNEGFIPLFITINSVFPENQDLILVISQARNWWVNKYSDLLQAYSKHPIISLDNDTTAHCFPSATIGLISHGFMNIDTQLIQNNKTFTHFRDFLAKAYDHGQTHPSKFNSPKVRPQLVLMSRNGSIGRVLFNHKEVERVALEIGFDVTIFEPRLSTPLHEAYALLNSSHAIVGVHGAALTHLLFLRPKAVFLQVVPLGTEWLADVCYARPARQMGLEYMEYKISADESSLIDKYNKSNLLIKDPAAFQGNKWSDDVMKIYLKEQNIRLDIHRFREYLEKAYQKAKKFMTEEFS